MSSDPKNTLYGGLKGIPEAVSLLSSCLYGDDQMMTQCIIQNAPYVIIPGQHIPPIYQ